VSFKINWQDRELLTIEQIAVLVCDGDPTNLKFIEAKKKEISIVTGDLIEAVTDDISIARKLNEAGYLKLDEGAFEAACADYGVGFYKSIIRNDLSALDKDIQLIRLYATEVKFWLRRHSISSVFFFPSSETGNVQEVKKTVQSQRKQLLAGLLKEHGEEMLMGKKRIGVWELLHQKDSKLFPYRESATESTVKKFFDNQSLLAFPKGR
jgi:hypothetical protein